MSYYERDLPKEQEEIYTAASMQLILDQEPNYFITLNFNVPNRIVSYEEGRQSLKRWQAMIDRELLGRNWAQSKMPTPWQTITL